MFLQRVILTLITFQAAHNNPLASQQLFGTAKPHDPYWLEVLGAHHQGLAAFHPDRANYPVFRNVKDYGAKGDGIADDTSAISLAMSSGNRCGQGCDSTTVSPAIVYFPQGTYLISSPIIAYYYTQIIGDGRKPPTLLAAPTFEGIALIDADPYIPGGGGAQWYINQNNFFRAVRNLVIDLRRVPPEKPATGIHWQVSQATSLNNVRVEMSRVPGNAHQGMFMENGSGGFMGDLVFRGGNKSLVVGNQQFTVKNIEISHSITAVEAIWNWGWTFQGVTIENCKVEISIVFSQVKSFDTHITDLKIGFSLKTGGTTPANQTVGAEAIVDAIVKDTDVFVQTTTANRESLAGSILLNNCHLENVPVAVGTNDGVVLLQGTQRRIVIDTWVQGNVYTSSWSGEYKQASVKPVDKPRPILDLNGRVFSRIRPLYTDHSAKQFVSVKDLGAKGDGATDDSNALQFALNEYAGRKIIYVPHGTYIVTSTLEIPVETILVGEVWSVIAGTGALFEDPDNPVVVVRVGQEGDSGTVEISDIIFTTIGPAGGAIVVEWNIHEKEGEQGTAAMFDSHIRLGGAAGTRLEGDRCPKTNISGTRDQKNCMAAFLALHLTRRSSAYMEGTWVWLADHDLDLQPHSQINVFSGRGILSESRGPVWMIGTGSEHHVLYQYNLVGAKDHWMGLIQTESPYYQPTPPAPLPFSIKSYYNDPAVQSSSLAVSIRRSEDVIIFGAGLYSFFSSYNQERIPERTCQKHILDVDLHSLAHRVQLYSVSTVGLTFMISVLGKGIVEAKDNPNGFADTFTIFRAE